MLQQTELPIVAPHRWSGSLAKSWEALQAAVHTNMAPLGWRPGKELKEAGLVPKHPVLIIPRICDQWFGPVGCPPMRCTERQVGLAAHSWCYLWASG